MFVKIRFEIGMSVMELARFCGTAPCSILAANMCNESELKGREIFLPVSTLNMARRLPMTFELSENGRITINARPHRFEHIVKPMQTLGELARIYSIDIEELKDFNKTDFCFLGQKILIP